MATRAERFKAKVERSGPKKPPAPKRKAKKSADSPAATNSADSPSAKSAVEVGEGAPEPVRRVEGSKNTAERNVSARAKKKAVTALEDSATGKPSRKSTRSSKNRGVSSENLQRKKAREVRSPEARAAKAKAKAKKTR